MVFEQPPKTAYFAREGEVEVYAWCYARLHALVTRYAYAGDTTLEGLMHVLDVCDQSMADLLAVDKTLLQPFFDGLYKPLSGTSDRTTEAPEG